MTEHYTDEIVQKWIDYFVLHLPGTIAEDQSEDQVMLTNDAVIEVMGVEQLSDYKLKLRFSDGTERAIDFEPFLKTSRNQLIRAYLEPEKFADFRIEYGDLVWGDYGLCFPIADLYEGHLSHPGSDR